MPGLNELSASLLETFLTSAKTHFGVRVRENQIEAARKLQGRRVVEMATGEGKTLVIALAACQRASRGHQICIATANDYLAQRDAQWMRPIFADLRLTVGYLQPEMDNTDVFRRDVIYGAIRQFGFDYLRARIAWRDHGLKCNFPLQQLIVDEADSVLIDEARTPLVINKPAKPLSEAQGECFRWAASVAEEFVVTKHYVHLEDGRVALTDEGHRRILRLSMPDSMNPMNMTEIVHSVERALWVCQTMRTGEQYFIRDDRIVLVDQTTGRASQRKFSRGIQQAIEAREDVPFTPESVAVARITIQDFVDLYDDVCGITATAREEAQELRQVYDLDVANVDSHQASRLELLPVVAFPDEATKRQQIARDVAAIVQQGRAVLIGTRDISESERLSHVLSDHGIEHVVLNALQSEHEATIVAAAGQPGQVTVATNMAGRGTHIPLADSVRQAGGLHVIVSQPHASSRIDRQLIGRTARQGDEGSAQVYVAGEESLFHEAFGSAMCERIASASAKPSKAAWLAKQVANAQARICKQHRVDRSRLTAHQANLAKSLRSLGLDPHLDPPPE